MFKSVVLILILLMSIVLANSESESIEEQQLNDQYDKTEAMEMVDELLHPYPNHHQKKGKRHCGRRGVQKLKSLCPALCHVRDEELATDMCSKALSNDDIQLRCCPKAN